MDDWDAIDSLLASDRAAAFAKGEAAGLAHGSASAARAGAAAGLRAGAQQGFRRAFLLGIAAGAGTGGVERKGGERAGVDVEREPLETGTETEMHFDGKTVRPARALARACARLPAAGDMAADDETLETRFADAEAALKRLMASAVSPATVAGSSGDGKSAAQEKQLHAVHSNSVAW